MPKLKFIVIVLFCFELKFLPSNLNLESQEIKFANGFNLFVFDILLTTIKFTASA